MVDCVHRRKMVVFAAKSFFLLFMALTSTGQGKRLHNGAESQGYIGQEEPTLTSLFVFML